MNVLQPELRAARPFNFRHHLTPNPDVFLVGLFEMFRVLLSVTDDYNPSFKWVYSLFNQ